MWEPGSGIVSEQFLRQVGPDVIAEGPWQDPGLDPSRLLDVIERSHRLFVPSRDTFGAMTFALEEVFLRNSADSQVRRRAQSLSETLRGAFIAYHKERTRNFQEPPARPENDRLNAWLKLEPGEFVMGAEDITDNERPPHPARVSGFSMQQHEVTNEEYWRFDPAHDHNPGEERDPVANVSWYEAAGYAAWLGASLPTEAEWEYAARGTGQEPPRGKKGRPYPWGFEAPTTERAVYGGTVTKPVGSLGKPGQTPEGLDDMAGNVWEWCRDWYSRYAGQDVANPWGPTAHETENTLGGRLRVVGGGSFYGAGDSLRAAYRSWSFPDNRYGYDGFRVVSSRLRP